MKDYRKEDVADFCVFGALAALVIIFTLALFAWGRGDDPMIAALLLIGWH